MCKIEREETLTEVFARRIADGGCTDEEFADYMADCLVDGMPELDIALDENEKLMKCLTQLASELRDDAEELVDEWTEDYYDIQDAKRSALYG